MRRFGPRILGFTLIELMIVVAVAAVLVVIAYPQYTRYTYRARRGEGQELLLRTATAQERYYATYNKYAASMTTDLKFASDTSVNGYYQVSIAAPTGGSLSTGYVLTAAPLLAQKSDVCGNLTLDSIGVKSQSGTTSNGRCW
ncbi:MAG: Fimbrial protein [Luteibacter sp.]|uniref:type IV pilin protein n=1 Tax=Luteibacter sp. TaxID=1886636 RepID=UPI0013828F1E|nr:type IV pilin protein [Luteibacter sp.]KAF1005227.1 MAG: Fimbrial protein [Luteibacter sp.]